MKIGHRAQHGPQTGSHFFPYKLWVLINWDTLNGENRMCRGCLEEKLENRISGPKPGPIAGEHQFLIKKIVLVHQNTRNSETQNL